MLTTTGEGGVALQCGFSTNNGALGHAETGCSTLISGRYLNSIAGNMVGVLEAAGMTAVDGDCNQLASAIQKLSTPLGVPIPFMTDMLPAGYLKADGSTYNIADYPKLGAAFGNTYGGDGTTTFAVPDLRGYFLRGQDNGSGNDPDASARTDRGDGTNGDAVGTIQDFAIENIVGTIDDIQTFSLGTPPSTGAFSYIDNGSNANDNSGGSSVGTLNFDASATVQTSSETRPKNIAVCYAFIAY